MGGIAELPEKIRIPLLLQNIYGRNETLIYLILAFIIVLYTKNSILQMNAFKVNYKTIIWTIFLLYIPLISLAFNAYNEFIYFNF